VREQQIRALKDQYHADALMYIEFPTVRLPFDRKGAVEWDGQSRSAFTPDARIDRSADLRGSVEAMSLSVRLTDLDGTMVYSRRVGIELLSRFTGFNFVRHSSAQLLMDEDKAVTATKSVLTGLTED
jgi:hypothetical protein